jgi:hypothetical protein
MASSLMRCASLMHASSSGVFMTRAALITMLGSPRLALGTARSSAARSGTEYSSMPTDPDAAEPRRSAI